MFETKTAAETEKLLRTGRRGLTEQEAKARLKKYGANEMEEKKGKGVGERFLSQLMDPLIYVLIAAGVVSILLGEAKDAAIIAVVVLLNASVGVIQEGKAQKALEALKKMTRLTALVMRDGNIREIDAAGLVTLDRVFLEAGRQVPADLRLTVSENLQIEESALTGESLPAKKDALFLAGGKLPAGDCRNLAYMSSNVTAGRGEGLVTATGMDTEIGRIAGLIREAPEELDAPSETIGRFGRRAERASAGPLRGAVRGGRLAGPAGGRDADHGYIPGGRRGSGGASGDRYDRAGPFCIPDGEGPYDHPASPFGGNAGLGQRGLFG